MKHYILIVISAFIFLNACKESEKTETVTDTKTVEKTDDKSIKGKDSTSHSLDTSRSARISMLPTSIVPLAGQKNWAFEFDQTRQHAAGIFILKNEQDIREFISNLEYAPPKELKASFVFEPQSDWWKDRDIKNNVLKNNLVSYRKRVGSTIWYFAIHKNREVYFWK